MRIKSSVRVGGPILQHNQTVARGLRVKSNIKVGGPLLQHNQTVAQSRND
jgi:hypothetical protein